MHQAERSKKIENYARGYDLLAAALSEVPQEARDFKPEVHEWSVREILVHMADSEINGLVRLFKLIAEPGSTLMVYQADGWAEAMHYQDQDIEDALQVFRLLRRRTTHLLNSLPDHVFDHSVVHPEYTDPYTHEQWLEVYTDHVPEHIEQMKKTHQAWKDQKK